MSDRELMEQLLKEVKAFRRELRQVKPSADTLPPPYIESSKWRKKYDISPRSQARRVKADKKGEIFKNVGTAKKPSYLVNEPEYLKIYR